MALYDLIPGGWDPSNENDAIMGKPKKPIDYPEWFTAMNPATSYTYNAGGGEADEWRTDPAEYWANTYKGDPWGNKQVGAITGPGGEFYLNPEWYSNDSSYLQSKADKYNAYLDSLPEGRGLEEGWGISPNYLGVPQDDTGAWSPNPEAAWNLQYQGGASPIGDFIEQAGKTLLIGGALAGLPTAFAGAGAATGATGAASGLTEAELLASGVVDVTGASAGAPLIAGAAGGATGLTEAELLASGVTDVTGASAGAPIAGATAATGVGNMASNILTDPGAIDEAASMADITGGSAGFSPASFFSNLSGSDWAKISVGGLGALSSMVGNYLGAEASESAMEDYLAAWQSNQWTDERRKGYIDAATNAITQAGSQQLAARKKSIADEMAARGTGGGDYGGSLESEQDKINALVANSINQSVLETYKPTESTPNINAFIAGNQDPWANTLNSLGTAAGSILPWWMMSDIYGANKT